MPMHLCKCLFDTHSYAVPYQKSGKIRISKFYLNRAYRQLMSGAKSQKWVHQKPTNNNPFTVMAAIKAAQ